MFRLGLFVTLCMVLQVAVFADARMVNIDGHTMVRLRAFCKQFGGVSDYDGSTNTYSISRNGTTVYMAPYSTTAWINDNQVEMKHVPVIIDGTMYAPLRFLCRAFDLNCTWAPGFAQVVIVDGFSHQTITWVRDDGWGARPHVWLHPDTFRIVLRFPSPPRVSFHGGPIPPSGHRAPGGPGQQAGRATGAHVGRGPSNMGRTQNAPPARNGGPANNHNSQGSSGNTGHGNAGHGNAGHGDKGQPQGGGKGDEHHNH